MLSQKTCSEDGIFVGIREILTEPFQPCGMRRVLDKPESIRMAWLHRLSCGITVATVSTTTKLAQQSNLENVKS